MQGNIRVCTCSKSSDTVECVCIQCKHVIAAISTVTPNFPLQNQTRFVRMEIFDWSTDEFRPREGLRSAIMECGVPFVTTAGRMLKHVLRVEN